MQPWNVNVRCLVWRLRPLNALHLINTPLPRSGGVPGHHMHDGALHALLLMTTSKQCVSLFPALGCRSGGVPGHHMMGRYAFSLAAVVKAQARVQSPLPAGSGA